MVARKKVQDGRFAREICARFRAVVEEKKIPRKVLANAMEVTTTMLKKYLDGDTAPGSDQLSAAVAAGHFTQLEMIKICGWDGDTHEKAVRSMKWWLAHELAHHQFPKSFNFEVAIENATDSLAEMLNPDDEDTARELREKYLDELKKVLEDSSGPVFITRDPKQKKASK